MLCVLLVLYTYLGNKRFSLYSLELNRISFTFQSSRHTLPCYLEYAPFVFVIFDVFVLENKPPSRE